MTVSLRKPALVQLIGDLIAEELARLRPAESNEWRRRVWHPHDELVPQSKASSEEFHEVVVDSLEWMAVAGRVVQFFNMEESGIEDYLLRKNTLSDWADIVAKAREIASEDITVTTSGSTGEPKAFPHLWSTLVNEAQFFSDLIKRQSPPVNQVVALVPSHHIYGLLFSVLLPDILDVPVVRGFKAFQKLTSGSLQQGDLVIGFPEALTQAVKLLRHIPSEVTFTVSGRIDNAVSIKGTNVYPSRIEATIESHPGVEAATVRKKKPDESEGLKAYVVMKSGDDDLTETSLKQWLSEHLLDIEIPTHVSFGSAIPTNSMGKRKDWTL